MHLTTEGRIVVGHAANPPQAIVRHPLSIHHPVAGVDTRTPQDHNTLPGHIPSGGHWIKLGQSPRILECRNPHRIQTRLGIPQNNPTRKDDATCQQHGSKCRSAKNGFPPECPCINHRKKGGAPIWVECQKSTDSLL
jgi:hypothetical protein